jgi:hypothetical protein
VSRGTLAPGTLAHGKSEWLQPRSLCLPKSSPCCGATSWCDSHRRSLTWDHAADDGLAPGDMGVEASRAFFVTRDDQTRQSDSVGRR